MKTCTFLFILCIVSVNGFCQSGLNNDSVVTEICYSLKTDTTTNDSTRVANVLQTHLTAYFKTIDQQYWQDTYSSIYYRLQHDCPIFKKILDEYSTSKGDWKVVSKEPVATIDKAACNRFFSRENYWYKESNGDTVRVTIADGMWKESFVDDSYSKLSFKRISQNEFAIVFIESNNSIRENYSVAGDTYKYKLLKENSGNYEVLVESFKGSDMETFKMYF